LESGRLIVCLEEEATQGLIDKIIQSQPEKVIFLDKAFTTKDKYGSTDGSREDRF